MENKNFLNSHWISKRKRGKIIQVSLQVCIKLKSILEAFFKEKRKSPSRTLKHIQEGILYAEIWNNQTTRFIILVAWFLIFYLVGRSPKNHRVIGQPGSKPLFGFFGSHSNQRLVGGSPKNHSILGDPSVKPSCKVRCDPVKQ